MICGVEGHILDRQPPLRTESGYSNRPANALFRPENEQCCDKVQKQSRLGIEWVSSPMKSQIYTRVQVGLQEASKTSELSSILSMGAYDLRCGRTHGETKYKFLDESQYAAN